MTEEIINSAMQALEEGRPHDAIVALEPIVEDDDENPDALVCLGMAYVQAEMPEKAVKVLEQADELIEQHCVVELFLGRALWALGKLDHAEDCIREAHRLDSSEPEVWLDLVRILYKKNQYREALGYLKQALELFPDELELMGLYALTLYRLGDFTAATEEWAKVHRLSPNLMAAVSNYAYLLLIQHRTFEAAPFVGHANIVDPDDYRAKILLGELRFQTSEIDGAKECFIEVVGQDPKNIEALSRLAVLTHLVGDSQISNHYLARAEAELGRDPESWRGLCQAYPLLGMMEKYVECLVRWTEADPGAAAPWILLAHEYDKEGKLEYARKAWRTVFELRGYVKIRCYQCKTEARLPYDEIKGFDVYQDVVCDECGSKINMPAGLALN
ncbi:MAG: tetratricopeptide repeat protein [Candidatus Thorarchaeota archaeon]|nr:tetratricopeptide repeat protein [Candidatus Thorarchaeota archaeon]